MPEADYNETLKAAHEVATKHERMLRNLEDDPEMTSDNRRSLNSLDDIAFAVRRIEELEAENEKLRKGFEVYQRERDRFKHATPEMSGAYFLTGGHGPRDDNQMPQFVEIVPAYGCGWSMVYENTGRTISYEGS